MKNSYCVLGIMSGTSLDGIDIAQCKFTHDKVKWDYCIEKATTYPYSEEWKQKLSKAETLTGLDLMLLHNDYGRFIGETVNLFLSDSKTKIDFIASHGHTIFHQPKAGLTFQIGNGANITATTGITTICDFRSLDVAFGGQGAPLVPIGDEILFKEYDYCLNLGGFANISYKTNDLKRIAFDICPVNILLNYFVEERNLNYDPEGSIGKQGITSQELLNHLNSLMFYKQPGPKSLGKEWVWDQALPLIKKYNLNLEDKLRTIYEHIVTQISQIIKKQSRRSILVTGGGVYNTFLIGLLQKQLDIKVVIPSKEIVDFKEALIFAFLGVLRLRNEINCLSSVTGAQIDNIGGVIFHTTESYL